MPRSAPLRGVRTSGAAECYQRAIDDAISAYGIDTSATNGVYYDPKLGGDGLTGFDRTVTIGPEAFADAGYLGASIAHEAEVHAFQMVNDNLAVNGSSGRSPNEAEAYTHDVDNARRFGLTDSEVTALQGRANMNAADAISRGGYAAQIAAGTYVVKPSQLHQWQ